MNSIKIEKKQINLGPIDLNFTSLTIGKGPKTVALVLGLHGVETSGMFVAQKLIERRSQLRNKVKIVTSANPSGLILASRFNGLDLPMDFKDPNRSFPGSPTGSIQGRINDFILGEVKDCDLVLDIHNYSNLGGPFPLLALEGIDEKDFKGKFKELSLGFLKDLSFPFIFFVDVWQAKQRGFSGTINDALNKLAIPNIGFEMPAMEFLNDKTIKNILQAFIRATNEFGKKPKINLKDFNFINTEVERSEIAGIFTPLVTPPAEVKKGMVLGNIFDLANAKKIPIKSPKSGLLVVIKRKNFVRVGEFLLEIGWKVKPRL